MVRQYLNLASAKSFINSNIMHDCPVSSAGILHHQTARKSQQVVSASGSGQLHTSALNSTEKTIRSNMLTGDDLGKAAAISTPTSNNRVPVSRTGESGAHNLPQQNRCVFTHRHL